MALPVTIPNTFANATSSIPLSQLDTNFSTLANAVNGLNSGSETLANLKATTANVGVLTVTGNATIGDASTDTVTLNSTLTANTAVIFAAGTSAAPSITTTGDTNTGIFFPAADTIAFTEGGAEAMRINSSGNVGIGTDSPLGRLQVKGANPQIFMEDSAGGTNGKFTAIGTSNGNMTFNRYLDNGTLFGQFMTIDSSGNVGIGTTSPNQLLEIAKEAPVLRITDTDTTATTGQDLGQLQFYTNDADGAHIGASIICYSDDSLGRVNGIKFGVSKTNFADATEAMRIDSSGNVTLQKNISVGGATPTTSGTGITFPATQSASSDANTLDDYEEGTWTGTLKGLTTDPTTPVTATGKYTKIGRQVTVAIYFNNVTTTGASGIAYISGLPFTEDGTRAVGTLAVFNFDLNTGTSAFCDVASTNLFFGASKDDAGWVDVLHNPGTSRYTRVTATYFV